MKSRVHRPSHIGQGNAAHLIFHGILYFMKPVIQAGMNRLAYRALGTRMFMKMKERVIADTVYGMVNII